METPKLQLVKQSQKNKNYRELDRGPSRFAKLSVDPGMVENSTVLGQYGVGLVLKSVTYQGRTYRFRKDLCSCFGFSSGALQKEKLLVNDHDQITIYINGSERPYSLISDEAMINYIKNQDNGRRFKSVMACMNHFKEWITKTRGIHYWDNPVEEPAEEPCLKPVTLESQECDWDVFAPGQDAMDMPIDMPSPVIHKPKAEVVEAKPEPDPLRDLFGPAVVGIFERIFGDIKSNKTIMENHRTITINLGMATDRLRIACNEIGQRQKSVELKSVELIERVGALERELGKALAEIEIMNHDKRAAKRSRPKKVGLPPINSAFSPERQEQDRLRRDELNRLVRANVENSKDPEVTFKSEWTRAHEYYAEAAQLNALSIHKMSDGSNVLDSIERAGLMKEYYETVMPFLTKAREVSNG